MPIMRKEIKEKWINALRSGEYKQCRGSLNKNKQSFCCLGVLTDLAIKDGVGGWVNNGKYYAHPLEPMLGSVDGGLPKSIIAWAGLSESFSSYGEIGLDISLAEKNDRGASFKQIANMIEKNIIAV